MRAFITMTAAMSLSGCWAGDNKAFFRYYLPEEDCYVDVGQKVRGPAWREHLDLRSHESYNPEISYYADEQGHCLSLSPMVDLELMTDRDSPQLYPCNQSDWDLCCEGPRPHGMCAQVLEETLFDE